MTIDQLYIETWPFEIVQGARSVNLQNHLR